MLPYIDPASDAAGVPKASAAEGAQPAREAREQARVHASAGPGGRRKHGRGTTAQQAPAALSTAWAAHHHAACTVPPLGARAGAAPRGTRGSCGTRDIAVRVCANAGRGTGESELENVAGLARQYIAVPEDRAIDRDRAVLGAQVLRHPARPVDAARGGGKGPAVAGRILKCLVKLTKQPKNEHAYLNI